MTLISTAKRSIAAIRGHLFFNISIFILCSIVISSFLILRFESGYAESQIKTVNDAVWWSAVGISTIGIGNVLPESTSGRYLTLFLMIVGVIIFSIITAKIASVFTEEEVKEDLSRDIKVIEGDLHKVEHDIEHEVSVDDRVIEEKLGVLEKRLGEAEKAKNSPNSS